MKVSLPLALGFGIVLSAHALASVTRKSARGTRGPGARWSITLSREHIQLRHQEIYFGGSHSCEVSFPRHEATEVIKLLQQFSEWAAVAQKQKLTGFNKTIGKIGGWEAKLTTAPQNRGVRYVLDLWNPHKTADPRVKTLTERDAAEFLKLLEQLPEMERELQ